MQEKLKPFTIIATKNELEEISKKILDSESMEIVPLENLIDDEILIRLKNEKENPYETLYENFLRIFELAERTPEPKTWRIKFPLVFNKDEVREFSEELYKSMREISQKVEELKTERNQLSREIELFEKLKPLRIKMEELRKLRTFKYKVGRINRAYFERLIESVKKDNILILSLNGDENFMWVFIIYEATLEIDKTLSIANFIEHRISENYEGTPRDILWNLWDKYRALEYEIETLKLTLKKKFFENRRYIYKYFDRIYVLKNIYDLVHKFKFTRNFFFISGWSTERLYRELLEYSTSNEEILVLECNLNNTKAPTLLKNKGFFKHFEFITKMFGTPSNNEIDPTPIISLLFLLFYGMMFGDVGHGLVLTLGGFLIYRKSKSEWFYILGASGISSMIFGILYGSFFGFEEVIKPMWKRPMDNINFFLILSIGFGIATITLAMVLNIVNKIIQGERLKLLFDPNGFPGISLYWILLGSILYMFRNGSFPMISLVFVATLVALMYLKEIIFGEGTVTERIIQGFVEVFEILLGYLSNTLSFLRLGAFALNHAGLFLAFYLMAKMSKNVVGSLVIILLGNILIIGLEGLIVFIQTLRLEYYEFFTRFFKGEGREFKPEKYKF